MIIGLKGTADRQTSSVIAFGEFERDLERDFGLLP